MSPPIYNELVKVPADLVKKDFPDSCQVEVTNLVPNTPLTLVSTVARKQDGSFLLTLNPKYTINKNSKLSFSADSSKFGKGELTIEKLAPGLKAIITADSNKVAQTEFQYIKDNVALTAILRNNMKLSTSLVLKYSKFSVGLLANVNGSKQELEGLEATFAYKDEGILVALSPKNKGQSLVVSAYDRINSRLALAGDLTVDLNAPDQAPLFNVCGQYYIDSKSFLKVKVNQEGRIGLGYTLPVNDNVKIAVGYSINGKDLTSAGKNNFGFNVNLNF
ncbi:hypothetical protein SAMD00019534_024570 [Acytostelium subglobosum LB1]|uniref:hypothetical protein n=1 Tax=Acytostelium subglobosum LB1 TaxID=1410327 RepID=UPI0006449240|nr:hypothetical protein SAMD00019534_024570 [Acytostelium subglobosum LB1]GAM19282.1 hypothetical protein SAMD00019534_024570 [Acytostelium subglobosum LB1]|eukprot:XP_012757209.1 hypothetical protein SAMD00019534_024570 [Acytostelium subglobosum LB1]